MAVTRRLREVMRAHWNALATPSRRMAPNFEGDKSCRNEVARSQVQAEAVPTGVAQGMPERVPRAAPETARRTQSGGKRVPAALRNKRQQQQAPRRLRAG